MKTVINAKDIGNLVNAEKSTIQNLGGSYFNTNNNEAALVQQVLDNANNLQRNARAISQEDLDGLAKQLAKSMEELRLESNPEKKKLKVVEILRATKETLGATTEIVPSVLKLVELFR